MLFEKLTNTEQDAIGAYIANYGPHQYEQGSPYTAMADLSYILRHWDANKQSLYTLLGDNLVIEKQVHIEADVRAIRENLNSMRRSAKTLRNDKTYSQIYRRFRMWIESACRRHWDYSYDFRNTPEYDKYREKRICWLDTDWFDTDALASNKYSGAECLMFFPDSDKPYQVKTGMRITRLLARVQKAYGGEYYTESDLAEMNDLLAMARSTANTDFTLGLSIHPLDYMTMSDNDMNWNSCMAWKDHSGDWRQGTVECMNSPATIVAYVRNADDMTLVDGDPYTWTNKSWRQLFVVDKRAVVAVKGYPFQNESVVAAILDWIKQLAKDNWHINYDVDGDITDNGDSVYVNSTKYVFTNSHNVKVGFCPCVKWGLMYNDIGTLSRHRVLLNTEALQKEADNILREDADITIELAGSGPDECMWCGSSIWDGANDDDDDTVTSFVICFNCNGGGRRAHCACCGDRCYVDDMIYVESLCDYMCEDCYNEHIIRDDITDIEYYDDNMTTINLAFGKHKENNLPVTYGDMCLNVNRYIAPSIHDLKRFFKDPKDITTVYTKTIDIEYNGYVHPYCVNIVFPQDLTEEGLEFFLTRAPYDARTLKDLCEKYDVIPYTDEEIATINRNLGYRYGEDEVMVDMNLQDNGLTRQPSPVYHF